MKRIIAGIPPENDDWWPKTVARFKIQIWLFNANTGPIAIRSQFHQKFVFLHTFSQLNTKVSKVYFTGRPRKNRRVFFPYKKVKVKQNDKSLVPKHN